MKNILFSFIALICILGAFGLITLVSHQSPPVTLPSYFISHPSTSSPETKQFDHIVIIIMENKSYSQVVGSSAAPFINSLIHQYSFAANYSAVSHPSLPNYIALIGGETFGITSDCTSCYISGANLVDQLAQNQKTWKAYMESMPQSCFLGNASPYAQKHNPFIYFNNIRNDPGQCQNIVPFTELTIDLKSNSAANFIWISPNLCHDMHDCSVSVGDSWLSEQVPAILNSALFTKENSLLVITWDEAEDSTNHIPTLLIGANVKKGLVSKTAYTHYSLLHTIENNWNLPPLTKNVENAMLMTEFFQ